MVLNPVPNHVPNHSQSLWAKHSEEKRFHCMTRNLRNAYPQCYELWSHYSERYPNLVVYAKLSNHQIANRQSPSCQTLVKKT